MYIKATVYGFVNGSSCPKGLEERLASLGQSGAWLWKSLVGRLRNTIELLFVGVLDQDRSKGRDLRARGQLFQLSCLLQCELRQDLGRKWSIPTWHSNWINMDASVTWKIFSLANKKWTCSKQGRWILVTHRRVTVFYLWLKMKGRKD